MDFGLRGIAGLMAGQVAERLALVGRRLVLYTFGVVCFAVTVAFLGAALFTFIKGSYGIYTADFVLAAVFVVVGLALLLIASMTGQHKRSTRDPLAGSSGDALGNLPAIAAAFAMGFARGLKRRR